MFIDASNPMQDALETIRGTDVISEAKKHALRQGLEALRRQHCPQHLQATGGCDDCVTRHRCLAAVLDLLGS